MSVKFAHIADCHLGAWHARLQEMNLDSFNKTIDICIAERVDFVLITGDLFDVATPPIDILKDATGKLKQLADAGIKCYIIAGSHDYSVSGKTFLDVLEKAGLMSNVSIVHEKEDGKIEIELIETDKMLIAGLPGKKAGLETALINRNIINMASNVSNKLKILALHTTISEAMNVYRPESIEFMDSINSSELPVGFDYYALGHIHFNFEKNIDGKHIVYPGPLFPNNFSEMDELKEGSFCIVNYDGKIHVEKRTIALNVESMKISATDKEPLQITAEIMKKIENLHDKIITLKVFGKLKGNISDIQFVKINELAEENKCVLLKNTSDLENPDLKTNFKIEATDIEEIEKEIIHKFTEENKSDFNSMINLLMKTFNMDKQEGETSASFEKRISQDIEKIIGLK